MIPSDDMGRGSERDAERKTGEGLPAEPPPPASIPRRGAFVAGLSAISAAAAAGLLPNQVLAAGAAKEKVSLSLKDADLAPKVNKLFTDLKDKKTQQEFMEDPVGFLNPRFLGAKKLSPQRNSNANRALYALLSNPAFMKWAESYKAEVSKQNIVDKNKVVADFAEAMAKHADAEFLTADFEDHAAIAEIRVREGDTDDIGVEVTTEVAVGAIFAVAVVILAIPVLIFGAKPTREYAFTAKDVRSIVEQLTAHGSQLRKSGKLSGKYIDLK